MTTSPTPRTAIVTGGSRGIGRAVVGRLAADGFKVVFTFASNTKAARRVEQDEQKDGHAVAGMQCDQSDVAALPQFFDEAMKHLDGKLDCFVANAGIIAHSPLADTGPELFDRVIGVNLRGTFFAVQQAALRMQAGGRIVCISTMGTAWPSAGEAAYAASKGGVEQLCRVASRELGRHGITVNCTSPGPTDTDMLRADVDEAARQGVASMTAMGRLGTADDVAGAVALLLAPSANWVTGQNLRADGGLA